MKWGKTRGELFARQESKRIARENWHAWFAWHPVRLEGTNGRWAWLISLQRKYHCEYIGNGLSVWWFGWIYKDQ